MASHRRPVVQHQKPGVASSPHDPNVLGGQLLLRHRGRAILHRTRCVVPTADPAILENDPGLCHGRRPLATFPLDGTCGWQGRLDPGRSYPLTTSERGTIVIKPHDRRSSLCRASRRARSNRHSDRDDQEASAVRFSLNRRSSSLSLKQRNWTPARQAAGSLRRIPRSASQRARMRRPQGIGRDCGGQSSDQYSDCMPSDRWCILSAARVRVSAEPP
jgi:hypothetical protein